jgi:hypothetical protein
MLKGVIFILVRYRQITSVSVKSSLGHKHRILHFCRTTFLSKRFIAAAAAAYAAAATTTTADADSAAAVVVTPLYS